MKIYYRQTNEFIEVSEEYYKIHCKERDLYRDKIRGRNECGCPKSKRWLCDMDCLTCEFRKSGKWQSIDIPLNTDSCSTYADLIEDTSKTSLEIIMDKVLLDELLKILNELDEESYKICKLIMDGYSERKIANELNIPKTTFQRRFKALKDKLSKKIKKFI